MTWRIVIVDDHPIYRDGAIVALRCAAGIEVVGEAADGPTALDLCREVAPDLVLLDVNLPMMSGLAVARALRAGPRPPRVVMLTSYSEASLVREALAAGAAGYIVKCVSRVELRRGVEQALQGEQVLLGVDVDEVFAVESAGLSPREMEILRHVAAGLHSPVIAERLGLSERTVNTNVANILKKVGAHTRPEAVAIAQRLGILSMM